MRPPRLTLSLAVLTARISLWNYTLVHRAVTFCNLLPDVEICVKGLTRSATKLSFKSLISTTAYAKYSDSREEN
jgi:hypothetical protein